MTTIDIADLAEPVRRAFAAAVHERRVPLAQRDNGRYIASGLAGAAVLAVMVYWGYGDPADPMSIQGPASLVWYLAAFAGLVGGAWIYRRGRTVRRLLGCSPGVYALGTRVIDARRRRLRLLDLSGAAPQIVHRYANGVYRSSSLVVHGHAFGFVQPTAPDDALEQLGADLRTLRRAVVEGDVDRIVELDPLGLGLALHASEPGESVQRPGSRVPLAIATLATASLATATWCVRNEASMEAAYARMHTSGEASAWIRNGGDHVRGERKKIEFELKEVVAGNRDHADVLRDALARYPDAPEELKQPVAEALHARYEAARTAALALSSSEAMTAFIGQMYDRLEAGGTKPVMQVVVAHADSSALARLDEAVAASAEDRKMVVPVAQYFTADDASRSSALKAAIQRGLAQFFPPDVTELSDEGGVDRPKIEVFSVIRPTWADGGLAVYVQRDAGGKRVPGSLEYPGIEFELGATLDVPGKVPQRVTFTARPAPELRVRGPRDTALGGSAVYGAMADSAFADLQRKLVLALGGRAAEAALPAATCEDLERDLLSLDNCPTIRAAERAKIRRLVENLAGESCALRDEPLATALVAATCPRFFGSAGQ